MPQPGEIADAWARVQYWERRFDSEEASHRNAISEEGRIAAGGRVVEAFNKSNAALAEFERLIGVK